MTTAPQGRVYTDVELGVNYITHLYTLAEAGFVDEDYMKKYKGNIDPKELQYLKTNAHLMSFYNRDQGPFTGLLYFTPAYWNFQTQKEWYEYFTAWNNAVNQQDFSPFARYSLHPQYDIRLFQVDDETWEKEILPLHEVFKQITEIFVANLENYQKNIWPEVKPSLTERVKSLNQQIPPDLVEKWESLLGYEFKEEEYRVVLFFAGAHGPSWNNLSLSKNTAFYNHDEEFMIPMTSHELGVHILLPYLEETVSLYERVIPTLDLPGIYGRVSYTAFESLAAFYNERLSAGKFKTGFASNDYPTYKGIFERIYNPHIEPLELYVQSVDCYLQLKKSKQEA